MFPVPGHLHPLQYWRFECATFAGDSSIESRPTLIWGNGNLSTYLLSFETAKKNVLVVYEITQFEHILNFVKKKQYAFDK